MQYDVLVTAEQVDVMSSFFSNLDSTICPVISCNLYEIGCTTPYAGSELSVGTSLNDWAILADRSIIAGYSLTVCYKC